MFLSSDTTPDDRELDVLAHVHQAQPEDGNAPAQVSQRSIANALGMSVGLTNAILKRLAEKGFLMMRRINQHNVHYLVTPAGIEMIGHRSYLYLRRTIGHVVRYKERLREFCRQQKREGITEIVLVGESDLTFLLEWCAEKEGLRFRVEPAGLAAPHRRPGGGETPPAHVGTVHLLSELHPEPASHAAGAPAAAIPLHEIVLGNH